MNSMAWEVYLNEDVVWSDTRVSDTTVFVFNGIIKACGRFKQSDPTMPLMHEVFKFGVPTNDGVPRVLTEVKTATQSLSKVFVEMHNSRSFALSKNAAAKALQVQLRQAQKSQATLEHAAENT